MMLTDVVSASAFLSVNSACNAPVLAITHVSRNPASPRPSSLVCTINYTTEAGANMFFRKFFKFEVLKPLDVKTKLYNDEVGGALLYANLVR